MGPTIHESLKSDVNANTRIKKTTAIFEVVKHILTAKDVTEDVRGNSFIPLVVSTLLHGSECWFVATQILRQLHTFYRRCIMPMRPNLFL